MASNISVGTQGWIDRINTAYRKSATAFIETGRLLIECKKSVTHGDWLDLLDGKLDFDSTAAQRLMKIARDKRLSNPAILPLLPKHFDPLYKLTKLKDPEFDQELEAGTINPQMRGKDVPKRRKEPAGGAVSDGEPLATPQPQDDRESGDSVVADSSDSGERSLSTERNEPERLFDPASGAPQSLKAGEWEPPRIPQPMGLTPPREGLEPYSNPVTMLGSGLVMAIRASRAVSPAWAVQSFPEDAPLMTGDITIFRDWLYEFEALFRQRYGLGNDAALQAAAD